MITRKARIRCTVRVGSSATKGLLTKRVVDCNVEASGDAKGKKNPEIVGKQTEIFILGVYPALEAHVHVSNYRHWAARKRV